MIGKRDYLERCQRTCGGDPFLVTKKHNLAYLSGTDAAAFLVVRGSDDPVLLTSRMEADRARESTWVEDVRAFESAEVPVRKGEEVVFKRSTDALKAVLQEIRCDEVRFDYLSEKLHSDLAPLRLRRSEAIEEARMVKSSEEIELIGRAREIVERAYEDVSSDIDDGLTELELAGRIYHSVMSRGADSAFEPIVAFGENSAFPHHQPTSRKLAGSSVLLVDMGAKVSGYCSDITRTIPLREGPAEDALDRVRGAIESVADGLEVGMPLSEADARGRQALGSEVGHMTHSLGHGLGLEVHEAPYLSPGSEHKLADGMVFTLEPGIYYAHKYGVRWEENFACTGGRVRRL